MSTEAMMDTPTELSQRTVVSPHALVDPTAQLGQGVHIGPFSVIGPDVVIGDHTWVGPHVVINGPCQIGSHNQIFQFSSIGEKPQDKKFADEPTTCIIGNHNVIREGVTIHRGTVQDEGQTLVGDHNLLMANMHVAHDCVIGNHTILANNVLLAGHVTVQDYALIGGGSAISQFSRVGSYSFVGGHLGVASKDILPFIKVTGPKPTPCGLNTVGLQRAGFSDAMIAELRQAYKIVFKQNLTAIEAVAEIKKMQHSDNPHLATIIEFIANSTQGILR